MATAIEPQRAVEERQGSDRSFGLVFATVFSLIGLYPLVHILGPRWWSLALAAVFGLLALAAPQTLGPLNRTWLAFGRLLHRIVSPLVMGAVFFVAVTPTAIIMRLRGRELLSLKWRQDLPSYWIERETDPRPLSESMKRQF